MRSASVSKPGMTFLSSQLLRQSSDGAQSVKRLPKALSKPARKNILTLDNRRYRPLPGEGDIFNQRKTTPCTVGSLPSPCVGIALYPLQEQDVAPIPGGDGARAKGRAMASKREAATPGDQAQPAAYQPTPREAAVLERQRQRDAETIPAPRLTVTAEAGARAFVVDHSDPVTGCALLAEALASADGEFTAGLVRQLADAVERGGALRDEDLNFLLAVVKGIKPRDQLEAMLAAQMAVTHEAVMTFARRLGNCQMLEQQDSAERAFNKLARTFVLQLEALKRYRSGGEQKVTVQHVTVSEGGQAIVGHVTQAARPSPPAPAPPPALTQSTQAPMPRIREAEAAPALKKRKRGNGRRSSA